MVAERLAIDLDESLFGVPECFAGKTVFVTGASGFMGKVLVEKLVRSCPDVKKVYILVRDKRGKSVEERLEEMSKLALFDTLHAERPGAFARTVEAVKGDVMVGGLGLSAEDRQRLVDEVNYVYHAAATVKFDQPLKDAIFMNTRGTREVCKLVLDMKHIHLVLHVSTAYAHAKHRVIEEKLYPPEADWRQAILSAEELNREELQVVMSHYMAGFPNTYTFTKGLAEQVIVDYLDGVVPCVILRPSIVISTWRDPLPGWIDNFNGPVGLLAANGTGLIRVNFLRNITADFVPVDMAIRGIINAVWYKLVHNKDRSFQLKTTPHNISANKKSYLTSYEVADMAWKLTDDNALSTCVWYPTMRRTQYLFMYWVYTMFLHVIPALFFDTILRVMNYKPIVLMIQRRIFVAVKALNYFMTRSWVILNDSLHDVEAFLLEKDLDAFGYDASTIDHQEYFRQALLGGMRYLLKEDMSKMESNCKRLRVFKFVDIVVELAWYGFIFYLLFIKWCLHACLFNCVARYWESL